MKDFLGGLELFKGFSAERLEELANRVKARKYNEKDIIIRQGENSNYFYIIKEGLVGVIVEVDKEREEIMGNLKKAGDFFGEIGIIYNIPRSATVIALSQTEVLYWNDKDFMELIFSNEDARKNLQTLAEKRLMQNEETVEKYKKTILDVIYRYNI